MISGTRVAWTTQWIDHDYGPIPGDIYFTNLEPKTTYDRVEGPNRYATAAKASALAYPSGADVAIIATGKNWPDALGGSALAGALDGPVLLVEHDYVPTEIANEIARLKPERAVILGSTDAVGSPVETWLRGKLGGNVTRIAGKNRYETADKVAAEVIRLLGTSWDGRFIVTTGRNFPDALAVAPLSNAERWPLVLSGATGLSAATSATVATGRSALILGDESAVPAAVQTKLGARLGTSAVTRLKGPNRYATALAIAQWGGSNAGLGWNGVALATGQNFPDALAGGVLQGKTRRLMLLTPTSSLDPGVASALLGRKASIDDVRFLGSDRAVSTYTRGRVALALE